MKDDFTLLSLSDHEIQQIVQACATNINAFGRIYDPSEFFLEETSIHKAMQQAIDDPTKHKVLIIGPRGIGKSTICRALVKRAILYKTHHFICYVSNSEAVAIMQTENIKTSLMSNPIVRELHGDIRISDLEGEMAEMFSKKTWVAYGDHIVFPRGMGQQIRGLNWVSPSGISYRPDLIVIDDLSNVKRLYNEAWRAEALQWFLTDLMNSVGHLTNPNWKVIYIDTDKHPDDIPYHLEEDPSWHCVRLSICDDNYKTLAPDFMPQEKLDEILEYHRKKHMMDSFAREWQGKSVSEETAIFKRSYVNYYSEGDQIIIDAINRGAVTVVLADPAKTQNMANAESGFVVWTVDIHTGRLFMRWAEGLHVSPSEFYDKIFELVNRFNASVVGIETTGLSEFITQPFKNEMLKRRTLVTFVELSAVSGRGPELSGFDGAKPARAMWLAPYYQQGLVYHNKDACGQLEAQLFAFPRPKRWDVLDAAAYIVQVMEQGNLYLLFNPVDADGFVEGQDIEKEYEGLMEPDDMEPVERLSFEELAYY